MFPSFQGNDPGSMDGPGEAPFQRMDGDDRSPFRRLDPEDRSDRMDRGPPPPVPNQATSSSVPLDHASLSDWQSDPSRDQGPGLVRAGASAGSFAAPSFANDGLLGGLLDKGMSFAADAALGAQVARVSMGLDAKVRKACESEFASNLGLTSFARGLATISSNLPFQGSDGCTSPTSATRDGEVTEVEHTGLCNLIQQSINSQTHLETVLSALEDYQRHRQGLAEAEQRLGLALQEAGQREQGSYGEALSACGRVHQQASARRLEAHAAEELHVVSKLRAHHGKAAVDCRRTARRYECTWQELQVLRRARNSTQRMKQMASGDSPLTPVVEGNANTTEESVLQRLRAEADASRGKLTMFQAKHSADYGSSMGAHMEAISAETAALATAFAGAASAAEMVKKPNTNASDIVEAGSASASAFPRPADQSPQLL